MFALFQKYLCCTSKTRSKSGFSPDIVKPMIINQNRCDTCKSPFPNRSSLLEHKENCVQNIEHVSKKASTPNKVAQLPVMETRKEEIKPRVARNISSSSSRKNFTDRDLDNTITEPTKVQSPNKSFSDTFTTEKNDRNNESVLSRKGNTSIISSQIELEVDRVIAELMKKPAKARREAELNFITRNIDKKTPAKFLVCEKWIEDYTSYLNGEINKSPEPMDNEYLKQMVISKTLPTNIYLINETIWRFVQKLYGGGPEIRQFNKSITFAGVSYSDQSSEVQTADTFSRSEGTESMRNSMIETQKSGWLNTPYIKPIGMANPSFYCYMNSCLQMLFGIVELTQYLSHEKYKNFLKKEDSKFWKAMTEIVHGHFRQQNVLVPRNVRKISMNYFDPDQQHDAHEFLRFLLSGMQDEVNLPLPKKAVEFKSHEVAWQYYQKYNVSLVDELLAGQLISTVTCTQCKHVSTTYDPFLDLSLPVIPEKTHNLDDCLAAFQHDEEMDEGYKCEKCKLSVKAIKGLSIGKCPKYLAISLKRFQTFPKKRKIRDTVSYQMSNWKIKEAATKEINSYSLIGVIVHFGPIDSGHYVCYTKRGDDWILCDDENISKVDEKEVLSREAYVLMYEKSTQIGVSKL